MELTSAEFCRVSVPAGDPGEQMIWFPSQDSGTARFSSKGRWSGFLFYSGLQLTDQGPSTLGRAICFPQSTDLNVKVILKHPHTNPECLTKYWGTLWPSQVDTLTKPSHPGLHFCVLVLGAQCFSL